MVPSAKEFLMSPAAKGLTPEELLCAYAELHRQECLKQAAQKARKQFIPASNGGYFIVNKDSILNAYSKKNIR